LLSLQQEDPSTARSLRQKADRLHEEIETILAKRLRPVAMESQAEGPWRTGHTAGNRPASQRASEEGVSF